jgi:hypothetical protein
MLADLLNYVLEKRIPVEDAPTKNRNSVPAVKATSSSSKLKRIIPKVLTYDKPRMTADWIKPEYDFTALQVAQQADSILLRSIKKKIDRLLVAGFEFVSTNNEEALSYIKRRISEIEIVSNTPFELLISQTAEDLCRQKNALWVKSRSQDSSSGKSRIDLDGKTLIPVAAYTLVPFGTVEFKPNKWGGIKKFRQVLPDGDTREYFPADVVYFYADKKAGFLAGTPDLLPALDDIALLRRIEENIEDLVETSLFPVYHFKIGNNDMPERVSPEGKFESEILERKIKYMDPGGVIVSDHRLEIEAIGSEGKALNIEAYTAYFLDRATIAAGTTKIDLGVGGDANKSTANTLSKTTILDVEAIQRILKIFIEFYVIRELLFEGGFNPLNEEDMVHIRFGVIDKDERLAYENAQVQAVTNNLITVNEGRKNIGYAPYAESDMETTYYKLFEEPAILAKSMVAGSAAGQALSGMSQSNVTPEHVASEKQHAIKLGKQSARSTGRPTSSKSGGAVANRAKPANQHGSRPAPKLNRDIGLSIAGELVNISLDFEPTTKQLLEWVQVVEDRVTLINNPNIAVQTIANNLLYRLINE